MSSIKGCFVMGQGLTAQTTPTLELEALPPPPKAGTTGMH